MFRERRGEGERGKETCNRRIDLLPLAPPQMETWPTTQTSDLTGNQTGDLSVCRPLLSPLSHTSQGFIGWFLYVPWWGTEPATFACWDDSNQLSYLAGATAFFFKYSLTITRLLTRAFNLLTFNVIIVVFGVTSTVILFMMHVPFLNSCLFFFFAFFFWLFFIIPFFFC